MKMTIPQIIWGRIIIALWWDANRTAEKCEAWHKALAARIDAKLNRK